MGNNLSLKNIDNLNIKSGKKKHALVIEVNHCHGECLPGYISYFLSLGYMVDVMIADDLAKETPLDMFSDNPNVKVEAMLPFDIIGKLNSEFIDKYKYCLINSDLVYLEKRFLLAKFIKRPYLKTKMIYICHDTERFNIIKKYGVPVVLKAFQKKYDKHAVNPVDFVYVKNKTKNNDIINFLVAGNIENQRKNFNLLIDTAEKLIDNDIKNFKITIIGQGSKLNFSDKILPFIDIKGRLTYSEMYKEVQEADYFLPLLDPENTEHLRYITTGTSGSFQLINGFLLPCLIEETFAAPHGYDTNNAIVYKGNNSFYDAMVKAINLDNNDYSLLQENLNILKTKIYNQSLNNFKKILKQHPFYHYSLAYLKLFFAYFLKQIFSIRNSKDKKYKIITILGLQYNIPRGNYETHLFRKK